MGKSLDLLKSQVISAALNEKLFRIYWGDDQVVFGAIITKDDSKPNAFSLATIYDSIYDLYLKIGFSFYCAYKCDLSESLADYNPFLPTNDKEKEAEYYIENMAFRTGSLWDLLAQLYNELWGIKTPINKLYYTTFFNNSAQGKNGKDIAKRISAYFAEEDEVGEDTERWKGNHAYAKGYRDQMTHRNSPNISTFSSFGYELRAPAAFSLKRITEDYLKAIEFIQEAVTEISSYLVENLPFAEKTNGEL